MTRQVVSAQNREWRLLRHAHCCASLNPESLAPTNTPQKVEYVDLANTKWGVVETTQYFLWKDAPSRVRRILRAGYTIVGTVRPGNVHIL